MQIQYMTKTTKNENENKKENCILGKYLFVCRSTHQTEGSDDDGTCPQWETEAAIGEWETTVVVSHCWKQGREGKDQHKIIWFIDLIRRTNRVMAAE